MGFATDAAAEFYDIKVRNVEVTSENAANITDPGITGQVSFDPATNTLTLNNATIDFEGGPAIYDRNRDGILTIKLQGRNTIIGLNAINILYRPLRISGGGTLIIDAGSASIDGARGYGVSIENCTLTANRRMVIKGELQINNSNVYVIDNYAAAYDVLGDFTLMGCQIVSPTGAQIKKVMGVSGRSTTVVDASGNVCTEVCISTGSQCHKMPESLAKFTLSPEKLEADASHNYKKVTLSCNVSYHVIAVKKPDWTTVGGNSSGYEASQELTIAFLQNKTGKARTGEITFTLRTKNGKEHTVTLPVTQKAASSTPSEPEQPAKFTLSPEKLEADASHNYKKVTLSCNVSYHVIAVKKPDWTTVGGNSSGYEASQELTIAFLQNKTGKARTGEITFTVVTENGKEHTVTLPVTQKAASSTPSGKLTLEPKELTVEADRSYPKLKISCDEEFLFQGVSGLDWVSLNGNTPDYEKSHTFGLIVTKNTGPERTGTVTVKTTAGNVKLKVTQRGSSSTPSAKLTLEPMALTMKYHRNEAEVTLACSDKAFSINQVVIDHLDWLSATGGSGLYKKHFIRITAQENPGAKRSGTVTFKTSEGEVTLNVTQEAKSTAPPTLTLTPTTLTFAASGGASQSVAVKSSVEGWGVRLKDRTQDWLTVTPDAAAKTVIVAVKPNTGTKKRSAEVVVQSDAGLTRSFFVTQQGNRQPEAVSGLSLNPEAMTMGGSSGAVGFTLKSDKPWTVTADADWLHPGSTHGNAGTTYFRLRFDQNTTGAVRTGKLTFTTTDGKATKTFTLTQRVGSAKPKPSTPSEGTYDYDLAVNPESITLSGEGGGSSIDVVTHRLWAGSTADDWITLPKAVGSGIVARCEIEVRSTVGNVVPYAAAAKIYATAGTLHLTLPQATRVEIYTLLGIRLRILDAPAGDTSVTLPRGLYIVRAGSAVQKVRVE